jgi:hypothetical protein
MFNKVNVIIANPVADNDAGLGIIPIDLRIAPDVPPTQSRRQVCTIDDG